MSDDDLAFIGKRWEDYELPPEKRYLLKYFTTSIQREFLRYYLFWGSFENFVDHTGIHCRVKTMKFLAARIDTMERLKKTAQSDLCGENAEEALAAVAKIEQGKFRLADEKI